MREMKDSGVEWIGKIPKDWEIVPLTKQLDSIVDYRGKTPEKTEEGTFLVTAKNDIVNIGLHFILKNVRPYAAPCSEA